MGDIGGFPVRASNLPREIIVVRVIGSKSGDGAGVVFPIGQGIVVHVQTETLI